MKTIKVVCAIIINNDQILTTQRGYGEFKGLWEFPGGKIELNETNKQALVREIKEELNVDIEVNDYLCTINYDYPTFHLEMYAYYCSIISGTIKLIEHQSLKWINKNELDTINWLEADKEIIYKLKQN